MRLHSLALLGLALATLPATAQTPSAPGDAARLWLKAAYGPEASARDAWDDSVMLDGKARRIGLEVCADSGPRADGSRLLAVCKSLAEAGHADAGKVDLWVLRATATGLDTVARMRDIESGGFGTPGDVSILDLGSGRTAFRIDSGFANMGWGTERASLYLVDGDTLPQVLDIAISLTNGGAIDCEDGGDDCSAREIAMYCTLQPEAGSGGDGPPPITVHAEGTRNGRAIDARTTLRHDGHAYLVDLKWMHEQGCEEGDYAPAAG